MSGPWYDLEQVRRRIAEAAERSPDGAVIFDADGTLWAHDVGCMVFDQAIAERFFREHARLGLLGEATTIGLTLGNDDELWEVAQALMSAHQAGRYHERAAAEMQVWAYAGVSELDFRELTQRALQQRGHRTGLHHEVLELASWARGQGLYVGIVSASPRWVVEEATRELDFDMAAIEAGDPALEDGAIMPRMARPLPYGPDKVVAGRRLIGSRPWLATFGDSGFDVDMMNEAELAVGIGERALMLEGLARHPAGVRLNLSERGTPR